MVLRILCILTSIHHLYGQCLKTSCSSDSGQGYGVRGWLTIVSTVPLSSEVPMIFDALDEEHPPWRLCQIRGQSKLARDVINRVMQSRRMAPLEVALKGRKPLCGALIWHKSFLSNWPPDLLPGQCGDAEGPLGKFLT